MGDPETEVVLPRLENDLVELLVALAEGRLGEQTIQISEKAATTIMLVSGGYPEIYNKGKIMTGFEKITDSLLFHAGTKQVDENIVTNGGRVLAITSFGDDFKAALALSNKNATLIDFHKKNYRTDIGFDL